MLLVRSRKNETASSGVTAEDLDDVADLTSTGAAGAAVPAAAAAAAAGAGAGAAAGAAVAASTALANVSSPASDVRLLSDAAPAPAAASGGPGWRPDAKADGATPDGTRPPAAAAAAAAAVESDAVQLEAMKKLSRLLADKKRFDTDIAMLQAEMKAASEVSDAMCTFWHV